MNTQDLKPLVEDLNKMISQGKILEAFDKYYADNVVMQENSDEPRVGKEANRKAEEAFAGGLVEFHETKVTVAYGDDGVVMTEWFMDMTHKDWGRSARSQVAVQKWENGKVVNERFYYGK